MTLPTDFYPFTQRVRVIGRNQDPSLTHATARQILAPNPLKALGVKLAHDDFDAGLSILAYLKRFHADNLKIDHSYVRDISADPDDVEIVRTIVNMVQSVLRRPLHASEIVSQVASVSSWQ